MKNKKLLFILLCLIITGCGKKQYTITFDTQGGSAVNSVTLNKGDTINDVENPIKEGYLFVNWLKDGIEFKTDTPITEDTKLTAKWIEAPALINDYTITYVTDEYVEKIMVEENKTLEEPKAPDKENYIFLGWYVGDELYDFNNKVTKDIVLTAKYKKDEVTVTFNLYDGLVVNTKKIIRGELLEIPETPEREGYNFLKWTLDDKEFSFDTKITEDITLKAVWEKKEYVTISFDTDGGNILDAITIEKYSKLKELPIPIKEGYKFIEWQHNEQTFSIDEEIKNNTSLKAIYEEEVKD